LNFDASNQVWIKIVHEGGKEVLVLLHDDVSVVVVCSCTG